MENECLLCEVINSIKIQTNSYFVIELETGYVVFEDYQFFKGYVIFISKKHVGELHLLEKKEKIMFLEEMTLVAEAVYKQYKPEKLNYELLGNTYSHLHWHIIPRYKNDLNIKKPIWTIDEAIRRARKNKPELSEVKKLKKTFNDLSKR